MLSSSILRAYASSGHTQLAWYAYEGKARHFSSIFERVEKLITVGSLIVAGSLYRIHRKKRSPIGEVTRLSPLLHEKIVHHYLEKLKAVHPPPPPPSPPTLVPNLAITGARMPNYPSGHV